MGLSTVAEADNVLGYLPAWADLDDEVKQRHLDTAALWLNVSFDWPGKVATCPIPEDDVIYAGGFGSAFGSPFSVPASLTAGELGLLMTPAWPRIGAGGATLLDCNGCPITGVPAAVKRAEIVAASVNLTVSLFPAPVPASTGVQGPLISEKKKVEGLEKELKWATPTEQTSSRGMLGQLVIPEVDALLACIACRTVPPPRRYAILTV